MYPNVRSGRAPCGGPAGGTAPLSGRARETGPWCRAAPSLCLLPLVQHLDFPLSFQGKDLHTSQAGGGGDTCPQWKARRIRSQKCGPVLGTQLLRLSSRQIPLLVTLVGKRGHGLKACLLGWGEALLKYMEEFFAKLCSMYRTRCYAKASNQLLWCVFQVTRYIHHKIIGKLHDAKVILTLGNTIWIDPMVSI